MNYRNVGMIAVVLVVAGAAFWWLARAPSPVATSSTNPIVPAAKTARSRSMSSARAESLPAARPAATPSAAAGWRISFDHGASVVEAFTAAAHAAEHGDPQALLTVRNYVAQCARFFGSAYQPWMERPESLPASGGLGQLMADERCMLIAHAPEFADRSSEDRLSPAYWQRVAERVDEPLAASFRVSAALAKLATAQPEERAALQASLTADLRHVLRSGDATAWYDLGSHGAAQGVGGDPSYGMALTLAACDAGYVWGGGAQTLAQHMKQDLPPDMYARTEARYLELQGLIRAGDWAQVETFLPLEDALFK
jgi:hypothetical protein